MKANTKQVRDIIRTVCQQLKIVPGANWTDVPGYSYKRKAATETNARMVTFRLASHTSAVVQRTNNALIAAGFSNRAYATFSEWSDYVRVNCIIG